MTRKKKPHPAPIVEDPMEGLLALTREELLELKLVETEGRAAKSEAQHLVLQRAVYLQQIDPQAKLSALDKAIAAAVADSSRAKVKQQQVKERVEQRLKLDLTKVSYDDETGAIHILDV